MARRRRRPRPPRPPSSGRRPDPATHRRRQGTEANPAPALTPATAGTADAATVRRLRPRAGCSASARRRPVLQRRGLRRRRSGPHRSSRPPWPPRATVRRPVGGPARPDRPDPGRPGRRRRRPLVDRAPGPVLARLTAAPGGAHAARLLRRPARPPGAGPFPQEHLRGPARRPPRGLRRPRPPAAGSGCSPVAGAPPPPSSARPSSPAAWPAPFPGRRRRSTTRPTIRG